MQRAAAIAVVAAHLALGGMSCTSVGSNSGDTSDASAVTAAERAAGWKPLFDGRTLTGWRGYRTQAVPAGWRALDGVMAKDGAVGDLFTAGQFGNFELAFDWKLSAGGNAGVFYRGTEEYDQVYWSAPEYQLLDDTGHADGKNRLTSAGAAFGLYPAPAGVVKRADQWNSALIVVRGNHVEHWLNDQKLLEYELASPDWEAKVKASKFVDYPNYGRAATGVIGFQGDHDGTLSLRNIRVKELK